MLYAAVGILPRQGLAGLDVAVADCRKAPGVVQIVSYPGLVCDQTLLARTEIAVVARGYWLARQALDRLMAQCGAPALLQRSSGPDAGVARAVCGNAQLVDGCLRLWVSTADMERSRALAARLSGIAEEYVDLRVIGSTPADASPEVLTAAIALAREMQPVPVQVILAPAFGIPALSLAAIDTVAGPESLPTLPASVPLAA